MVYVEVKLGCVYHIHMDKDINTYKDVSITETKMRVKVYMYVSYGSSLPGGFGRRIMQNAMEYLSR